MSPHHHPWRKELYISIALVMSQSRSTLQLLSQKMQQAEEETENVKQDKNTTWAKIVPSSDSEMFLVLASELTMVSLKENSMATMKWHQSKPQRKEIWDQRWYILDISILFLWWKAVFPECMRYFLTLLQTTDLNYTEVSGVYVLFLFFIFDAYILIFIYDIGTIGPRRQICH